jgi:hypothetical protein
MPVVGEKHEKERIRTCFCPGSHYDRLPALFYEGDGVKNCDRLILKGNILHFPVQGLAITSARREMAFLTLISHKSPAGTQ